MNFKLIYLFLGLALFSCSSDFSESPYPAIHLQPESQLPGTGRSSAVGFAIGSKGYVALGRNATWGGLKDCWEYNPDTKEWTQTTDFPGVARVKAMAASLNGKAYVGLGFNPNFGVYSDSKAYLKDFWSFDPLTNSWTRKADFPGSSTDACVSFVYNNLIYVGSGFNGYGFTDDFWTYNPETDSWKQLQVFSGRSRAGSVICTNGRQVFFGTGYRTYNLPDWWEYTPETDSWKQVKSMPDNGRINAISLSVKNRIFVSTGRQFGGNLTGGHVKSDILEYNPTLNCWYNCGTIPGGGRENAISFCINGKGYIGFGENDKTVLNDLWSFEP